jgi:hypothetical protein
MQSLPHRLYPVRQVFEQTLPEQEKLPQLRFNRVEHAEVSQ